MKYITIGKIINTHGIKGELKIEILTDEKKRFDKLESVYLDDYEELIIESVRDHKGFVLLKFKGYDDIDSVYGLRGKYINIHEEDRIDLPEDNFFIYEIIGLKVFDTENNYLGKVEDVLTGASNDIYLVKDENREFYLPAVKSFIEDIDLKLGSMKINLIEGLIE